jgi:uncharacterized protein
MIPVLLLVCSNVFMNLAWYGHLKWFGKPEEGQKSSSILIAAILVSWGLAFFEYCLQVPANRMGYHGGFTAYQLKIIQEALSITVFMLVAWVMLGEGLKWNYVVAFALIMAGVCFAVLPETQTKH